jgi:hypothetical protein
MNPPIDLTVSNTHYLAVDVVFTGQFSYQSITPGIYAPPWEIPVTFK